MCKPRRLLRIDSAALVSLGSALTPTVQRHRGKAVEE